MEKTVYKDFTTWLDNIIEKDLPEGIEAYNFNLYEGKESFHVQLIGAGSFSLDDEDWACDELFSSKENIFVIARSITGNSWEQGLNYCFQLVKQYLESGKYTKLLKASKAVGVGFVDGDIEIIYQNN